MNKNSIDKYNSHAKFLADIAIAVLNEKKEIFNINGIKEIISLYLLVPYITPTTLETPDDLCKIPHLEGKFLDNVTLENLRNAICHSFVTVEEYKKDGTNHGKYLIFDDRIVNDKKSHSQLGKHSSCYCLNINEVHKRLMELFKKVQNF